MGVPDFEGGWSTQPSMWRQSCVRQAAFALSLAHVINEIKREGVCPLAVREIWAFWDESMGSPKRFKLHVAWGMRPRHAIASQNTRQNWTKEELSEHVKESNDFWGVCATERDEGMLAHPFTPMETILVKKGVRISLIYRDARVGALQDFSQRTARLWRLRRATLRSAAGEVGDLLRTIGAAFAYAALPMPSGRLTIREISEAREEGMGLAIEALMSSALHGGGKEAALEYDFACREAGEIAVGKNNAVVCMAYLFGFFMALSDHEQWARVASGGEQEVYFGLLCRVETTWGESLDAMQRAREF